MDGATISAVLSGKRVMIVEDEFLVAMELESELLEQGCVIIGPAGRSCMAMALLEGQTPDAVLLDLNLDGEVPTALAEALVRRQVPFVVVTGYGSRHPEPEVLRAAPRLEKPVHGPDLIAALSRAVGS